MDMNRDAILGYTGFVGSNLSEQIPGCDGYNSKNLTAIVGRHYQNVYCCCVPGVKYLANRDPGSDLANIRRILKVLKSVKCENFFLASSQDCNSTLSSDEKFTVPPPTEYGKNRLYFENEVRKMFNVYTIRLGCIFGAGLKKNIVYDLLNSHYTENITEDFTLQIYSLKNLKSDFNRLYVSDTHLANIFSEPVWVSEIVRVFNECGYEYSFHLRKNESKCYSNAGILYPKEYQLKLLKEFVNEYRNKQPNFQQQH